MDFFSLDFSFIFHVDDSHADTDIHSLKLGSESCQAYFGTDPRKLLRLVQRDSLARTVPAVGRFVGYAKAAGNSSRGDPVAALCKALTGSLHGREQEKRRLSSGARHGRLLASDFSKDDGEMTSGHQEQIVALTDTATSGTPSTQAMTNIACDTHATTVHLRKRRGDEAFGCEVSQGAVFTRVRWDWTGDAAVALASLLPTSTIETSEGESTFNGRGTAGSTVSSAFSPNQPRKVKCRVTMSGSDVLAGMRELVEAGFMKGPLPPYIQDAALYLRQNDGDCEKSGDGLIYVDHGAVLG